jgi:hypothetical protein
MRLPGAAVRVVTAPDGTEWKLYVARFELPRWRPSDYEGAPASTQPAGLVFVAVDAVVSLVDDLLLPLLRLIATTPFTVIRSSRLPRRRIEVLTLWPHEERYVWETDAAHVERVVDEIAAGLERGTFAQPSEADFLGLQ